MSSPAIRRCAVALLGLLLGTLAVLVGPAVPASAHAALVDSSPAAGSTVPSGPPEVVLTFSEPIRQVPGKSHVIGPDGSLADGGTPTVRDNELHVPVRGGAARGTYLVSYRVISTDSHPVGGSVIFSVGAPSASVPTAAVDAGRVDPVVDTLVSVARFTSFIGLLLLVGAVLVLDQLWPGRLPRRGPGRLAFAGVAIVLAGAVAELLLQAPYTAGTSLFGATAVDLSDAFAGRFGAMHLIRVGALTAAAVLLRPLLTGQAGRADRALLVLLAVVGLASWPIAGHPGASSAPLITTIADVVHLGAVAVWLGGLVMLVGFLLRRANAAELAAILPVWSRWAAGAVAALVLSGTVQAVVEVRSVRLLLTTGYGRYVVAKIMLLAGILVVAAYSRRLVRQRVDAAGPVPEPVGAAAGPGRKSAAGKGSAGRAADGAADGESPDSALRRRLLRRSVLLELGLAAVVLAVTAALVQTTPATTAGATGTGTGAATGPYSAMLTSKLYQLQLDIDPATTGSNTVHLYAYTPAGAPLKVVQWTAIAALPGRGIEPMTVNLLPVTDNHAVGEITFTTPGSWQISVTVRISDFDQATVTQGVPVR
jgi:copper transport protein